MREVGAMLEIADTRIAKPTSLAQPGPDRPGPTQTAAGRGEMGGRRALCVLARDECRCELDGWPARGGRARGR
eukprot:CAMPEP_0174903528 /NCGR_PEP_ID=MMETSP0167-20121228/44187_1 /TAXON_ID=38298 /ORGANISM="Rhodella maculata, Strain CCMP736" /LENGTH=72 /DNA_ID=CAMNT_0016145881 /DNA_START=367 /DNA_END=582 /DNA_ORIENTATION=-